MAVLNNVRNNLFYSALHSKLTYSKLVVIDTITISIMLLSGYSITLLHRIVNYLPCRKIITKKVIDLFSDDYLNTAIKPKRLKKYIHLFIHLYSATISL